MSAGELRKSGANVASLVQESEKLFDEISSIVEVVRSVPLFAHLTDREVMRLASALQICHFTPGQAVIKEGEVGTAMYIVEAERVRRITSYRNRLAFVVRGIVVGLR